MLVADFIMETGYLALMGDLSGGGAGSGELTVSGLGRCLKRLAFLPVLQLLHRMSSSAKNLSIKKAAARLVRELPESASWDDLMYEILVRQKIEAGLNDLREQRTHDHAVIRREFGLP
jgi:hypothetical protein